MADEFNGNTELLGKMLSLFRDFDLEAMTVEYRKDAQELDVTIRPYPARSSG
jgi:hypothetical protein